MTSHREPGADVSRLQHFPAVNAGDNRSRADRKLFKPSLLTNPQLQHKISNNMSDELFIVLFLGAIFILRFRGII